MVFIETTTNFTSLIATEEEGLIGAGFGVIRVEVVYYFSGGLKDFGAFDRGFCDRDFAMGATGMEGKINLIRVVVPVEGVFHLITVMKVAAVGKNFRGGNIDMVLAEYL